MLLSSRSMPASLVTGCGKTAYTVPEAIVTRWRTQNTTAGPRAGYSVFAPQRTPRVIARASLLPNISSEHAMEAVIGIVLIGTWGALMMMSLNSLGAYATKGSASAAVATASISSATTISKAPLPVLLLRGMAALCGVSISAFCSFFAFIPTVAMRVLQALCLALVGSLLHMT